MVVAVGGFITVTVCKGEIALGEIRCSSDFVGAVLVFLYFWQHVVSLLEVGYNLIEQLLVCKLVVASLLLKFVLSDVLVNPRHLTEHGDELEVEVSTEEFHFSYTLLACLFAQFGVAILLKREQRTVATAHSTIKAIPEFVKFARRRGHCRPYLHWMIASVGGSRTALQAIV